jgi:hypothetical protein
MPDNRIHIDPVKTVRRHKRLPVTRHHLVCVRRCVCVGVRVCVCVCVCVCVHQMLAFKITSRLITCEVLTQ